jgi:pyridoxine kinase
MRVLSIQSSVATGHVGNGAALFALRRLGIETIGISTVTLAHHPARRVAAGAPSWRGRVSEPAEVATLLDGLEAVGELKRCDAILSGYLGDVRLGPALLDAVERVKRANPRALYYCDPVLGDAGKGFYVRAGIPEFFRDRVLPHADVLLPNMFELAWLVEGARDAGWDAERALSAARTLLARGARLVVVKGLRQESRGRALVGALAASATGAWLARAPEVEAPAHGAGDLFSALFVGRRLLGASVPTALARAVSSLHGVMARTAAVGSEELALVEAQAQLVDPKRLFKAVKIG